MKSSNRAWLLIGAAALAVAIPALAQNRDAPESLLPEGFGDPGSLPPPEPKQTAQPGNRQAPRAAPSPARADELINELTSPTEPDPLEAARPTNYFSIPVGTSRPTDVVGLLEPGNFGLAPNAFGADGGAFRVALMRGLDAPLPSRWASILLRRALLSRLAAPAGVDPVDWVAERAWLLLRMGEADAARMLVQSVDDDVYTPRMIEVAVQAALATADPSGLCPFAGPAARAPASRPGCSPRRCAPALEGEAARASALIDQARGQGGGGIDLALAEKVIGAGGETRRAAAVEWEAVPELNAWRFGLASAHRNGDPGAADGPRRAAHPGLVRARADDGAGSAGRCGRDGCGARRLFVARAGRSAQPDLRSHRRRRARRYGRAPACARPGAPRARRPGRGDAAALGRDAGRAGALRPADPHRRRSGADRAGARLRRRAAQSDRGDAFGRARPRRRRAGRHRRSRGRPAGLGDARRRRRARRRSMPTGSRLMSSAEPGRRGELLVAASPGSAGSTKPMRPASPATPASISRRATLEPGARRGGGGAPARHGALLVAVGMQTGGWGGVPPRNLYRSLRALRAVGLEYEARMIAAEAIART